MNKDFLPVNMDQCSRRGWSEVDFVYVVGEAYVDHPSFGHAIISRVLENAGYKVAMLCLPDYHTVDDFKRFGQPRLGFLVSAGVIDSMVNHYTVAKKVRNTDVYSPGGKAGLRPDRATIVYCNKLHQAYPNTPILIGGIEASLRRLSHYDYWDDKVRHSILVDSAATLLMYGMGEKTILECASWLENGSQYEELANIDGICYMAKEPPLESTMLPSHKEISEDKRKYAQAFKIEHDEQDPIRGHVLCQKQDDMRFVVQNKPAMPLTTQEMDKIYELPYTREYHPSYEQMGGVPALQEVKFSITAERGCFGACSFCALTFHQGRIVTGRSEKSLINEARELTKDKDFKGYIHDVGGPTANFFEPSCEKQLKCGTCKDKQCMFPQPCENLNVSHKKLVSTLKKMRKLPNIKKVFVRSGIRFDYVVADKDTEFLNELVKHHISGQLRVAPEHVSNRVLDAMGKPRNEVYQEFLGKFKKTNDRLGMKQYAVPYLISSHPGSRLEDAIILAEYLRDEGLHPDQVQDFYPTPFTVSTCMYYTGIDPRNMKKIFVPRSYHEKTLQRALLQFFKPNNAKLVREALRLCGRDDLIGFDKKCLVSPGYSGGKANGSRRNNSGSSDGRRGSECRLDGANYGSTGQGKSRKKSRNRPAAPTKQLREKRSDSHGKYSKKK